MTDVFGAPVSRNTLLRLIAPLPDPPVAAPRVVGADEYAQRKGRILLDGLSRRSLRVIDDTEWHDSPTVYQEALDNVPKSAFSPEAHCWWNTQAAGRLLHLLSMARADAASAQQQAPWR
ncbi:hypothetical protein ABZT02_35540 [Streptomyces sp. NPDC005402]|uniref:hypothetical protein n=1 Tax=Streptomyces sp. NPDC005402 TaxID=3155338 RepID=UPI0033BF7E31